MVPAPARHLHKAQDAVLHGFFIEALHCALDGSQLKPVVASDGRRLPVTLSSNSTPGGSTLFGRCKPDSLFMGCVLVVSRVPATSPGQRPPHLAGGCARSACRRAPPAFLRHDPAFRIPALIYGHAGRAGNRKNDYVEIIY